MKMRYKNGDIIDIQVDEMISISDINFSSILNGNTIELLPAAPKGYCWNCVEDSKRF